MKGRSLLTFFFSIEHCAHISLRGVSIDNVQMVLMRMVDTSFSNASLYGSVGKS